MTMVKGEDSNSPKSQKGPVAFPAKGFLRACPHHTHGRMKSGLQCWEAWETEAGRTELGKQGGLSARGRAESP